MRDIKILKKALDIIEKDSKNIPAELILIQANIEVRMGLTVIIKQKEIENRKRN